MLGRQGIPSPALIAAQRRLEQLKRTTTVDQQAPLPAQRPPVEPLRPSLAACLEGLPAHLGWGSATASDLARRRLPPSLDHRSPDRPGPDYIPTNEAQVAGTKGRVVERRSAPGSAAMVKLYPDLALGMLRHDQAAAGRIWLLLRHLDQAGQGRLRIDLIHKNLTNKQSPLRVCGRRHLRHLLQQGRGIFWERDRDQVWLRSAARVAQALEVGRLQGRPVALPVSVLLQGIGQVRAHLYASFHSGRDQAGPVSRRRLAEISQVPERTQRVYDRAARVVVRCNLVLGPAYEASSLQESAWRHGRATFRFVDARGKQGPVGRQYVAWRLPNSYQGPHAQCPRGRQKKINRQIDLVRLGAQGNDLPAVQRTADDGRLFHPHGQSAARAYHHNHGRDIYWLPPAGKRKRQVLWHVLIARTRR